MSASKDDSSMRRSSAIAGGVTAAIGVIVVAALVVYLLWRNRQVCFKTAHARFPIRSPLTNSLPKPPSNSARQSCEFQHNDLTMGKHSDLTMGKHSDLTIGKHSDLTMGKHSDSTMGKHRIDPEYAVIDRSTRKTSRAGINNHTTRVPSSGCATLTRQFLTDGHKRVIDFHYKMTLNGHDPMATATRTSVSDSDLPDMFIV